jgi:eukaryotic-like serine/threonine-protein kinase
MGKREDGYQAFISYSRKDGAWAQWLQRELERYVFPRELIGRVTPQCTIGRRLGKLFLDTEDLPAGGLLSDAIVEILRRSEALIVLCSPAAATSNGVKEEIAHFRRLGRADRIFPIVVDCPANADVCAYFPSALLPANNDQEWSDISLRPVPIAADVRPDHDGKEHAKLRIIAGLVGLSLGELRQRNAVAERRRRRTMTAAAVISASVAVAALISTTVAFHKNRLAEKRLERSVVISAEFARRVVAESDQLGIPSDKALTLLRVVDANVDALAKEEAEAIVLKERKAEMSLAFCDVYMKLGRLVEWEESAKKAQTQFAELIALNPNDQKLIERFGKATYQRALALQEQSYLDASQELFLVTADIRRNLLEKLPHGDRAYPDLKRDLSAAHLMIGQGYRSQGIFSKAFGYFESALKLREELAASSPDDDKRQQDIAMVLVNLGETYFLLNDLRSAELAFERGLQIRRRLYEKNPDSNFFKRHYGWALAYIGRLRLQQGDADASIRETAEAIRLMEQVRDSDKQNVIFQNDVAWFYGYRGEAAQGGGRFAQGLSDFAKASDLLQELLDKHDGTHMERMRGVAYWTYHRAVALSDAQQFEDALPLFDKSISLLIPIIASDETNAIWRAELASNHIARSSVLRSLQRAPEAADELKRARRFLPSVDSPLPYDFGWSAARRQLDKTIASAGPTVLAQPIEREGSR